MKRVIGLVFLYGAASCVPAAAAPAPAKTPAPRSTPRQVSITLLAPADEYFGPLKVSIIGIRNTIRDAGLRYDVNHDTAHATYASAQMTERAIRDWEVKYPRDDQLPRAVFLLQRLYTKILSQESRDRAHTIAVWLLSDFKTTPQAKQLERTLAVEHLAPLPSPAPAQSAAPNATTGLPATSYQSVFGPKYPSQFTPTPPPK